MYLTSVFRFCRMFILIIASVLAFSTLGMAQAYHQTNFVSDIQGLAPTQDGHLLNPWGLISSSTSPWWVSDNNGGVSTLYNGNTGAIVPLVVNIPPLDGNGNGTGTPTGVVFTGASSFMFQVKRQKGGLRVHVCHRRWHDCGLGSGYQIPMTFPMTHSSW